QSHHERFPEPSRALYPTGGTAEEARVVHVNAGRDTTAIDVTLALGRLTIDPSTPSRPPRSDVNGTGRIAGTVTDAVTAKPVKEAQLVLLPVGGGPSVAIRTHTDRQ